MIRYLARKQARKYDLPGRLGRDLKRRKTSSRPNLCSVGNIRNSFFFKSSKLFREKADYQGPSYRLMKALRIFVRPKMLENFGSKGKCGLRFSLPTELVSHRLESGTREGPWVFSTSIVAEGGREGAEKVTTGVCGRREKLSSNQEPSHLPRMNILSPGKNRLFYSLSNTPSALPSFCFSSEPF